MCAALVFDSIREALCLDETTALGLPIFSASYNPFCLLVYIDLACRDVVDEHFLFRTECSKVSHSKLLQLWVCALVLIYCGGSFSDGG